VKFPDILAIDKACQPIGWIGVEAAAYHYTKGTVLDDSMGGVAAVLHGGVNAVHGRRSELEVRSILMLDGPVQKSEHIRRAPPVTLAALFERDRRVCAYCGGLFQRVELEAEHVLPESRGGAYVWTNLVSACRACNQKKGNRTPEEARMPLLYVPYTPVRNEWMILSGRRISGDQMDFLMLGVPKHSRLHQ
jgi:hypothetical protein